MTRLSYSPSAFRRSMRISRVPLFIFVEGFSDRYVYDRIAQSECQRAGVGFKIVTADEIAIDGGGKEVLLKFFDYLAGESSLICNFQGKTTISIFFLDKDVDDILKTKRESDHIVYTETYNFENYLFIHGELSEVAASSASIEVGSIRNALGEYEAWRRSAASKWKKWVGLCLFSRMCSIRSMSNYERPTSPINVGICGSVKSSEYKRHLSYLKLKSQLPPDDFKRLFAGLCHEINRIYSAGRYDQVFKGNWYVYFLIEDIKSVAGRRRYNNKHLAERLLSGLALTLDYSDSWAEHFREPIRRLITKAVV